MLGKLDYLYDFFDMAGKYNVCILQVSFYCNIDCSFCFVPRSLKRDRTTLPPGILEKVIKQCAEQNITMYTGVGDPFAWWDYTRDYLIPLSKKYNAKLILSTNGLWGNNPVILKEALDADIDILCLSIDHWHRQFVPAEATNNIIAAFKDVSTKLYVQTVANAQHPRGETKVLYDDEIERIWYEYDNQADAQINRLTHNKRGDLQWPSSHKR